MNRRRSGRAGGSELYCSNCGTGLEASSNYCPNCGAPAGFGPSRAGRTTAGDQAADEVTDRDVLEYRIATAAGDGWKLEHDFGDHAVMVRRGVGSVADHVLVALVTVWFTMGFGNVLYGGYKYVSDPERMVVRADRVEGAPDDDGSQPTLLGRATAAFSWLVAGLLAVVGLQIGLAAASYLLFALAFVFAVLGVTALPSVARRLENRHPVTANGRVRSVDERTVVAYDRSCAACADTVGRGVERTYREEFCVLGVPMTDSEGHNYYCRSCANGAGGPFHDRRSTRPATDDESSRSLGTEAERGAETEMEFDR